MNDHVVHHQQEQQQEQLQGQNKMFGLNGFVKNITNNVVNYVQHTGLNVDKISKGGSSCGSDTQNNNVGFESVVTDLETPGMLKKLNNLKLQPPSPMYDRYPKVGTMKVYPITTPDREEPKLDNTVIQVIQESCS